MVKVLKKKTQISNIYTYFEFTGYDSWNEFDKLIDILTNQMGCIIMEKLDGIYSRHCILRKGVFEFKLIYHEDFGNCLCSQDKKDNSFYEYLEKIANEVALILA